MLQARMGQKNILYQIEEEVHPKNYVIISIDPLYRTRKSISP